MGWRKWGSGHMGVVQMAAHIPDLRRRREVPETSGILLVIALLAIFLVLVLLTA